MNSCEPKMDNQGPADGYRGPSPWSGQSFLVALGEDSHRICGADLEEDNDRVGGANLGEDNQRGGGADLGEDNQRSCAPSLGHKLVLGGYLLPLIDPLYVKANSDGDVVLHALIRALTGLSGQVYLGSLLIEEPVRAGERNSCQLFRLAWNQCQKDFAQRGQKIFLRHLSISLEAKHPKIAPHALAIRQSLAGLTGLEIEDIGLTAMTGEGLTACGKGEGIRSLVIVTAQTQQLAAK